MADFVTYWDASCTKAAISAGQSQCVCLQAECNQYRMSGCENNCRLLVKSTYYCYGNNEENDCFRGKLRLESLKPNFTLTLLVCLSPQLSISVPALLLLHLASNRELARKIWVLWCPHTRACMHGGKHTYLIQELWLRPGVSCLSLLIAVMFLLPSLICPS